MTKKITFKKIIIFSGVVLTAAVFLILSQRQKPIQQFATVKRGELSQYISVTGHVKPAQSVDLAFETSGRVSRVLVDVGQKVFAGQTLAVLENSDFSAQTDLARAGLEIRRIELEELKNGARPEEIAVYQAKKDAAKVSSAEAEKGLVDKIKDAYTKADDSVRGKTDKFFNNPRTDNPQINLTVSDSQLENEVEELRQAVEVDLLSWNNSLSGISTTGDLAVYLVRAKDNLNQIRRFLEKLSSAVNGLAPTYSLSQITIDSHKADVSAARASVNTAVANLALAEETLNTSRTTLTTAEKELSYKMAPATVEQIASQEALIRKAEAELESALAQLNKTIIVSPIVGTIARQDAKRGEIAVANTILISIISGARFEIETNMPEADVAKVKIGNEAKITLDAFGQEIVFSAKVVEIDLGETMVEGVATYKTKLQFSEENGSIKSGMTANIDILAEKKEGVLFIPQRAIVGKNGQKSVFIISNDGKNQEVVVKTGLRDSNGNIEIIEGLAEGDKVIIGKK